MGFKTDTLKVIRVDGSLNIDGSIFQFNQLFTGGGTPNAIVGSGVAKITVGTAQPASPTTGDLWIDTN
jgi:hypothetical protein